ncbi:MAG TPA: MBL fold metallo-hydrolase [Candidatus Nanoarchaeia archaeon]|nr:MBL fold metallo-hydrolase [Candidatus Nanoarchaeia archaeon]
MEKLTFLGIAGNDAPSLGLASSCFVLNYRHYQLIFDPGPGTLIKAREANINIANTNIILVSHAHLNHCNELNLVIDAMTFHGLDNRGLIVGDESVINGSGIERPILSRAHKRFIEKEVVLMEDQELTLPGIKIQALKTQHSLPSSLGYRITTDELTIVYSGDTKNFDEIPSLYKNADILILNVPYPKKTQSDTNLNIDDAHKIIYTIKPRLAILTHFNKQLLKESPIYYAREIQRETNIQTIAAKEGLTIDIMAFSKLSRQNTLNKY